MREEQRMKTTAKGDMEEKCKREKNKIEKLQEMKIRKEMESAKRTKPGSFQWCSVTRQEAVGTKGNTEGAI